MPLLDHFHGVLDKRRHWESFHGFWAGAIARQLNRDVLPAHYVAEPLVKLGVFVETDVGTFDDADAVNGATKGVATAVYAPSKPTLAVPVDFSGLDVFEVQVSREEGGPTLVAAIELVSPSNKDRPATRDAFIRKCACYLQGGVSLVLIDVVTSRLADIHAELLKSLGTDAGGKRALFTGAYRAVQIDDVTQLQVWIHQLALGQTLPTVPLWIEPDLAVPVDLECSYQESCEDLRIR